MFRPLFIILFFLLSDFVRSEKASVFLIDSAGVVVGTETIEVSYQEISERKPNPLLNIFRKKHKRSKRITAAVLAFPFPFGIVGLHRIYLGTKPFVPVAYIASLGGGLGVLPFIDFCVLILDKEVESYSNNGKVFMWIK